MSRTTSSKPIDCLSSMNVSCTSNTATNATTTASTASTHLTDCSSENTVTQTVQLVDQPIILLVTANIGSIFDSPDLLLNSWTSNFLSSVQSSKAHLVALHCQEVGGKDYQESMKNVNLFVKSLLKSHQLIDFDRALILLDEDFTSTEKFTALGNLYFIHQSISDCQIWDFEEKKFSLVSGRQIFSGNIERVTLKEKDKFPVKLFPECKWSRKGFMRTRWSFSGAQFDLINIHLFHDVSNLSAMKDFPNAYTKLRHDALEYTLDRIENDQFDTLPFFIFGDFNFRLDTGSVIKRITNNISPRLVQCSPKGNSEQILYENSIEEDPFLTIGKKVFDLINQEDTFYSSSNHHWLLEYDNELESFKNRLFEFAIDFPPSYPFTEDACGHTYMKTRCPAWCDRVFASYSALPLILQHSQPNSVSYRMVGPDSPMGDHKPISLSFRLKTQWDGVKDVRINGDESTNVHTSKAASSAAAAKSPALQLDEASGHREPLDTGIRLRTFSTPIQSNAKAKFTCDNDSPVNVDHKVSFRRNNSLVSDVIGDVDNVSFRSDEWLAQRQSFLRMLSEAKCRQLSQAVDETSHESSHSPQVVSNNNNGACEDAPAAPVMVNSSSHTPPPPILQICPPFVSRPSITTGGHHSSSSEDEEWRADVERMRMEKNLHHCHSYDKQEHEIYENDELKSHVTLTPCSVACTAHNCLPTASVTQQIQLPPACYSAESETSMPPVNTLSCSCAVNEHVDGKIVPSSPPHPHPHPHPHPSHSPDTKTKVCSGKKLSNKCPGCMLV